MNRKRRAKQFRRNALRMGAVIEKVRVTKDVSEDMIITKLPKREWGYSIDVTLNGWDGTAFGDSWYEAWKGVYLIAKAMKELGPRDNWPEWEEIKIV